MIESCVPQSSSYIFLQNLLCFAIPTLFVYVIVSCLDNKKLSLLLLSQMNSKVFGSFFSVHDL